MSCVLMCAHIKWCAHCNKYVSTWWLMPHASSCLMSKMWTMHVLMMGWHVTCEWYMLLCFSLVLLDVRDRWKPHVCLQLAHHMHRAYTVVTVVNSCMLMMGVISALVQCVIICTSQHIKANKAWALNNAHAACCWCDISSNNQLLLRWDLYCLYFKPSVSVYLIFKPSVAGCKYFKPFQHH